MYEMTTPKPCGLRYNVHSAHSVEAGFVGNLESNGGLDSCTVTESLLSARPFIHHCQQIQRCSDDARPCTLAKETAGVSMITDPL